MNRKDLKHAGEQCQLVIIYQVVEPVDGLSFSQPNEAYSDQAWYVATDHKTEQARYWHDSIASRVTELRKQSDSTTRITDAARSNC